MFSLRAWEPSLKCKPQGTSREIAPGSLPVSAGTPAGRPAPSRNYLPALGSLQPRLLLPVKEKLLSAPALRHVQISWDCRSQPYCGRSLPSLAVILLNKASPYLCPNWLFGRGDGRLAYLYWGPVLKSVIVLAACITALLDTRESQGNANWKGAKRGSAESKPSAPQVTLSHISHHPLCVCMCLGSRAM